MAAHTQADGTQERSGTQAPIPRPIAGHRCARDEAGTHRHIATVIQLREQLRQDLRIVLAITINDGQAGFARLFDALANGGRQPPGTGHNGQVQAGNGHRFRYRRIFGAAIQQIDATVDCVACKFGEEGTDHAFFVQHRY